MVQHLLAIDDVQEDFERILKWASKGLVAVR